MNDLFPTKNKEHNMKMKNGGKYDVKFANTERLKKGSIITMQNYLNEDEDLTRKRNIG